MDWRRKRQIRNLIDGILEQNVLHRPPIDVTAEGARNNLKKTSNRAIIQLSHPIVHLKQNP